MKPILKKQKLPAYNCEIPWHGRLSQNAIRYPLKVGDKVLMLCHKHYDIWETSPEGLARQIKKGYNPKVAVLSKSARLSWD